MSDEGKNVNGTTNESIMKAIQIEKNPDAIEEETEHDKLSVLSVGVHHRDGGGAVSLSPHLSVNRIQPAVFEYGDTAHKKTQSLSDPTASPAQRSTRSRNSIEKSPRKKRSKSESRRKRERKMIAAGELEVKQANETLMRYLRQCTEINDASLSGELEIDKSLEDRRVHRKTRSQRERRSYTTGKTSTGIRDHISSSNNGLATILNDLVDDIIPSNGEIYNPFTPVISPTEGPPNRERLFIQTPNGYKSVYDSRNMNKDDNKIFLEVNRDRVPKSTQLASKMQRIWTFFTNICHGLLGGLALTHLILIFTTKPQHWDNVEHLYQFSHVYQNLFFILALICMISIMDRLDISRLKSESLSFIWAIILITHLGSFILTLTEETTDDRFNPDVALSKLGKQRFKHLWDSLCMVRSICAIVGWILIASMPHKDALYNHLKEMETHATNN